MTPSTVRPHVPVVVFVPSAAMWKERYNSVSCHMYDPGAHVQVGALRAIPSRGVPFFLPFRAPVCTDLCALVFFVRRVLVTFPSTLAGRRRLFRQQWKRNLQLGNLRMGQDVQLFFVVGNRHPDWRELDQNTLTAVESEAALHKVGGTVRLAVSS